MNVTEWNRTIYGRILITLAVLLLIFDAAYVNFSHTGIFFPGMIPYARFNMLWHFGWLLALAAIGFWAMWKKPFNNGVYLLVVLQWLAYILAYFLAVINADHVMASWYTFSEIEAGQLVNTVEKIDVFNAALLGAVGFLLLSGLIIGRSK